MAVGRGAAWAGVHFELVSGWGIQCLGHRAALTASSWREHSQELPEGWLASRKKERKALQ